MCKYYKTRTEVENVRRKGDTVYYSEKQKAYYIIHPHRTPSSFFRLKALGLKKEEIGVTIKWLEEYCKDNKIWEFTACGFLRTGEAPLDIITVGGKEQVNLVDVKKLLIAAKKEVKK